MSSLKDVSVIVLSHNRRDELCRNLPTLLEGRETTGFELIIVDNASSDGSRALLQQIAESHKGVRVILKDENVGVAEGRNTGARIASGTYLLFLDDDLMLTVDDIFELRSRLVQKPHIGVVSPRILHAQSGSCQNEHGPTEREVGNFHGACHMVRGDVLRQLDYLDPLCSFGAEELDLSIRMRAHGYGILYAPSVVVKHNSFTRKSSEHKWRRSMWVFNFSRIHFKHFPLLLACRFTLRYLVSQVFSALTTHGFVFSLGLPWQALRGAVHGRRQYRRVPNNVISYYKDPNTKPDFGNVPLRQKFFSKLFRRCRS